VRGDPTTEGETKILGGFADPPFKDEAPAGGLLIGFDVGLGKFVNNTIVAAIRPIFRTADGKEVRGKQHGTDMDSLVSVKAKPGYAVGAITVKSGLVAVGFSVTFMEVGANGLDRSKSYESEWIGGKTGGPETVLGGSGTPVVGLIGHENDRTKACTGIGLLLRRSGAQPETPSHPPRTVRDDKLTDSETKILGGVFDPAFKDEAPEGGLLVGFEVGLGQFVNNPIVVAIRPIFRTADGKEERGKQHGADTRRLVSVQAKPGYAVGAITVKAGLVVDGFSATFMEIGADGLDPSKAYESEWIGGKGGDAETRLGGSGMPVVGLIGHENARTKACTGLGLLLRRGAAKPQVPSRPPR
jgi:hypothetical protein